METVKVGMREFRENLAGYLESGRPLAIMGVTPGRGGTALAQTALLPVARALGTQLWAGPRLFLSSAGTLFDDQLALVDPAVQKLVTDFMAGFAAFVADQKR